MSIGISDDDAIDPSQREHFKRLGFRRVGARTIDEILLCLLMVGAATTGFVFLVMVACVASLVLKVVLLAAFGTTPGKRLLGLRLEATAPNDQLTLALLAKREVLVWVYGLGGGVALLGDAVLASAAKRYVETGRTAWDDRCGTRVVVRLH